LRRTIGCERSPNDSFHESPLRKLKHWLAISELAVQRFAFLTGIATSNERCQPSFESERVTNLSRVYTVAATSRKSKAVSDGCGTALRSDVKSKYKSDTTVPSDKTLIADPSWVVIAVGEI